MKITVILTSYNHEKFLKQSIDSILNQTYKDIELIIVDDCSTDQSWEIICEYKKQYPEIITLRHEFNWGGGTVEDTVKNYASGDYIAVHHSDDVWEIDKLQKQIEVIKEHPECVAVFTNAVAINDEGEIYEDKNGFYYDLFSVENRSREEWLHHFFYNGNCLCHPSILIKKSIYEEDGFFRKGLRQIPDFVKWIQICKKHEIYVIPDKLVKFRIHAEGKNTSGMRADTQIRSSVELFLMLNEYLDIREKDEFVKIFPEAKKYCEGNFFSTEYVLGRICTEPGMPPYTRIFGNQLLYRVLNIPEQAQIISEQYHYSYRDFIVNNGKYDIFGMLPPLFEQTRTLYWDCGHGFNEKDSIYELYTLSESVGFKLCFSLKSGYKKEIKNLRFDPCEGIMSRVKLMNVLVNGISVEAIAENALLSDKTGDVFITLDPIYTISIPKELVGAETIEVRLEGMLQRLSDNEIAEYVTKNAYEKRDEIYDYQKKLYQIEENNRVLQVKNNQLQETNSNLIGKLKHVEEHVIYKIVSKFHKKE